MTFLFLVLLVFATHAAHAQTPQAQVTKVDLSGIYYTERMGNDADPAVDNIHTPPGYKLNPPAGQSRYAPGCFQKGSAIANATISFFGMESLLIGWLITLILSSPFPK
jgi:hypothetical protein